MSGEWWDANSFHLRDDATNTDYHVYQTESCAIEHAEALARDGVLCVRLMPAEVHLMSEGRMCGSLFVVRRAPPGEWCEQCGNHRETVEHRLTAQECGAHMKRDRCPGWRDHHSLVPEPVGVVGRGA